MSNGLKAESCGLAVLRIVVGVVFAMHGWQKIHVFHLAGVTGMLSHLGFPMPTVFRNRTKSPSLLRTCEPTYQSRSGQMSPHPSQ